MGTIVGSLILGSIVAFLYLADYAIVEEMKKRKSKK